MPRQDDTRSGLYFGFDRGISGWGTFVNKNFEILAYQGTHIRVINSLSTPPANPTEADCYIVGSNATGAWAGWTANDLAVYGHSSSGGGLMWMRLRPKVGWLAFNSTSSAIVAYNGSAWQTASLTASQIAAIGSVNVPTMAEIVTGIEALPEAERLSYRKLKDQPPTITADQATKITASITRVESDSTLSGDGSSTSNALSVTNPFTSAFQTKLEGIDDNATDDQTGAEIKTALEGLTGTSRLEASAIQGLPQGTTSDETGATIKGKLESLSGANRLDYSAIQNAPPATAEQNVQSDWNEGSTTSDAYIQNKPTDRLMPAGGADGEVLTKTSSSDYAVEWGRVSGDGQALTSVEIRNKLQELTDNERLAYSDIQPAQIGSGLEGDGSSTSEAIRLPQSYVDVLNSLTDPAQRYLWQANWDEPSNSSFTFIRNKPDVSGGGGLTEVATDTTLTGDGDDTPLSVANPFSSDEKAKLTAIESNATRDQTAVEIRDALQTLSGNDRLPESAVKDIRQLPTGGTRGQLIERTDTGYQWVNAGTSQGEQNVQSDWNETDTAADSYIENKPDVAAIETRLNAATTKLASIETGATADQTASEIVTSIETLSGTSRLDASAIKNLPSNGGGTGLNEEQVRSYISSQAGNRIDDLISAVADVCATYPNQTADQLTFTDTNPQALPNAHMLDADGYSVLDIANYDPIIIDNNFIRDKSASVAGVSPLNDSNSQEFELLQNGSLAMVTILSNKVPVKIRIGRASNYAPLLSVTSPTGASTGLTIKLAMLSPNSLAKMTDTNITSPTEKNIIIRSGALWVNMALSALGADIRDALVALTGANRLPTTAIKDLNQVPATGTTGYVLTKTASGYAFEPATTTGATRINKDSTLAGLNTVANPLRVTNPITNVQKNYLDSQTGGTDKQVWTKDGSSDYSGEWADAAGGLSDADKAKIDEAFDLVREIDDELTIRASLGNNNEDVGFANYRRQRSQVAYGTVMPSTPNPPTFEANGYTYRLLAVWHDSQTTGEATLEILIGGTNNAAVTVPDLPDTTEFKIGGTTYRRRDFDDQFVPKAGASDAYIQLLHPIGTSRIFRSNQVTTFQILLGGDSTKLLPTGGTVGQHLVINQSRQPAWTTVNIPTNTGEGTDSSDDVIAQSNSNSDRWSEEVTSTQTQRFAQEVTLNASQLALLASGNYRVDVRLSATLASTNPGTTLKFVVWNQSFSRELATETLGSRMIVSATGYSYTFSNVSLNVALGTTHQLQVGFEFSNSANTRITRTAFSSTVYVSRIIPEATESGNPFATELLDDTRGLTIASATIRVQQPLTAFTTPLTLMANDHGIILASLQARIASGSTQQIRLGVTKENSEQVFLSRLRASTAYTGDPGTAGNGVRVAGFEIYNTSGVAQGSIHCYVARNAANQVGTYATYTPASGSSGAVTGQVQIDWEVSLLRTDYSSSGGGSTTLGGLTDVTITNPMAGQTVVYDPTTMAWVNRAVTGTTPSPINLPELYVTRQASDPANVVTIRDARGTLGETFVAGMQFNLFHGGTAASQTALAANPFTIRIPISGGLGATGQRVQLDKSVTFTTSATPTDVETFSANVYYLTVTSRPAASALMLHAYDDSESFSLATTNAAARGVAYNPVRNLISVIDGGSTKRHFAYNPTGGGSADTRYTQTLEGDPYGCSWDPDGRHLYVYDRDQFRVYDFGASTNPASITIARVSSKEFSLSNWIHTIHGIKVTATHVHVMGFRFAGSSTKTIDVFDKAGNRQLSQSDQNTRNDAEGFAASSTLAQQWSASSAGSIAYNLTTFSVATKFRPSFNINNSLLISQSSYAIIGDNVFTTITNPSPSRLAGANIRTQVTITISPDKPAALRELDRVYSSGTWLYVSGYNVVARKYEMYSLNTSTSLTSATYSKLSGDVPSGSRNRRFAILNDRLYFVDSQNQLRFVGLTGSIADGYTAISATVSPQLVYLWTNGGADHALWTDGTDLYFSYYDIRQRETSGNVTKIDGTSYATTTVFTTRPIAYNHAIGAYDSVRQVNHIKSEGGSVTRAFVDSASVRTKIASPQRSFPLVSTQGLAYDIGYNESADKVYMVSGNSLSTYDTTVAESARAWRENSFFIIYPNVSVGQLLFTDTNAYVLGGNRSRGGNRSPYYYYGNKHLNYLTVLRRPGLTVANRFNTETSSSDDVTEGFFARDKLYVRFGSGIRELNTNTGQYISSSAIGFNGTGGSGLSFEDSGSFLFGDPSGTSFWLFGTSLAKLYKFNVPASVGSSFTAVSEWNIGTTHYGSESSGDYRCGVVIGAFVYLVRIVAVARQTFSTLYFDAFSASTGARTTAQDFTLSRARLGTLFDPSYSRSLGAYINVTVHDGILYVSSKSNTVIYAYTRS